MISIQSTLQVLVPDQMRGRVMGFYGMTWSIMPLGGLQAGALANVGMVGAHGAIIIGGITVAAFALGPAFLNRKVRSLDAPEDPKPPGSPTEVLSHEKTPAQPDN